MLVSDARSAELEFVLADDVDRKTALLEGVCNLLCGLVEAGDELPKVVTVVNRALGVCFGHQVANAALGGTVEAQETTCRPVEMAVEDGEPLFDGVSPIVPVAHGDVVTEVGDGMEVIASSDYYHAFATRHRDGPLWTVQFHPEFTSELRERLEADFGWTEDEYGFGDVTAARVVENFVSLVADDMETTRP